MDRHGLALVHLVTLFHMVFALIHILTSCQGEMEPLASVLGPIEVCFAAEQLSKATVEVNVHPLSLLLGSCGTEAKALAASLRGLLSWLSSSHATQEQFHLSYVYVCESQWGLFHIW